MEDVSKRAELKEGRSWEELEEMLENYTQEPHPQIYSVKTVEVPNLPVFLQPGKRKTLRFL